MKPFFIFTLLISSLFFTNCDNNTIDQVITCNDERFQLEDVELEDSTRNLFYNENDILVFKNAANGNELRFTQDSYKNSFEEYGSHICATFDSVPLFVYNSEHFKQVFVAEDYVFSIVLEAFVYYKVNLPELTGFATDDVFHFDFFSTKLRADFPRRAEITFIASSKENDIEDFDTSFGSFDYSIPENDTINGVAYEDIYISNYRDDFLFYFSKEEGIIAFNNPDDNSFWIFDRIE